MLTARKHELETEEHLRAIAERESGRLNQENQRLAQQLEKLKEKRNIHEVSNFKHFFKAITNKKLYLYFAFQRTKSFWQINNSIR